MRLLITCDLFRSSSPILVKILALSKMSVFFQPFWASFASFSSFFYARQSLGWRIFTASVTSSTPARHAFPKTSPVAGFKDSNFLSQAFHFPAINSFPSSTAFTSYVLKFKTVYNILSWPEYTYKFGFLTNATSVIPTIFESATPVLNGAALLTTMGIPARATFATIPPESLPVVTRA